MNRLPWESSIAILGVAPWTLTCQWALKMANRLTILKGVWEAWKRLARRVGNLQVRVLLFVFYFVVLAPFALIVRWASDPMAIKPGSSRGWRDRPAPQEPAFDQARRQF